MQITICLQMVYFSTFFLHFCNRLLYIQIAANGYGLLNLYNKDLRQYFQQFQKFQIHVQHYYDLHQLSITQR